jgi:hypothetical protein
MNLGTMKTALRRMAGVDATDPLVDWINAAMTEFCEAYDWPFLDTIGNVNTVASNDELTLPTDFLKMRKARIVAQGATQYFRSPLKYIPYLQSEDEEPKSNAPVFGEPYQYTLVGTDFMILFPIPNLIYTVRINYDKFPVDLVADVDVPDIPSKYHYTLVEGAAVRALQAESEEDRAQTARSIFEDSIDRHITKLGGNRQAGEFHQTRDVMGYGS